MVRDGSYTCEQSITIRVVEPLCCTPETNVALCVNYAQIKTNKAWVNNVYNASWKSERPDFELTFVFYSILTNSNDNDLTIWRKKNISLSLSVYHAVEGIEWEYRCENLLGNR